jgi:hypothetical protein
VTLEDHAALERGTCDLPTAHDHAALGRLVQSGQDVQDGGLAASGVADDAGELTLLDPEEDVFEDREVGRSACACKAFGQSLDLQKGLRHAAHSL